MVICACNSGKGYEECCQPYHDGKPAINALTLMRSRYAAYALGLVDYIIDTTHPANPSYVKNRKKWKKDILIFTQETQFVDLDILNFIDGEVTASVVFYAKLKKVEQDVSFTEDSKFVKEQNRWFYLSGDINHGTKEESL